MDSKYAAESGRLSSELDRTNDRLAELEKAYAAGNKELESEINALKLDQLSLSNRIANLEATHSRDVSSLQSQINEKNAALSDKIDSAVADLRQAQLAAENRYREQVRELNDRLAGLEAKLDAKVDRLTDADRELYKRSPLCAKSWRDIRPNWKRSRPPMNGTSPLLRNSTANLTPNIRPTRRNSIPGLPTSKPIL